MRWYRAKTSGTTNAYQWPTCSVPKDTDTSSRSTISGGTSVIDLVEFVPFPPFTPLWLDRAWSYRSAVRRAAVVTSELVVDASLIAFPSFDYPRSIHRELHVLLRNRKSLPSLQGRKALQWICSSAVPPWLISIATSGERHWVELRGLEPLTPTLPVLCSPS